MGTMDREQEHSVLSHGGAEGLVKVLGGSENGLSCSPALTPWDSLCSSVYQWERVPPTLYNALGSSPVQSRPPPPCHLQTPWFPGLLLTAAQFILAGVSHVGLVRRSDCPRGLEQSRPGYVCSMWCLVCMCVFDCALTIWP
jgi:hypothetical protein